MNRTFVTTTLAAAVLSLTACKGGAGDSVKLIPDSATAVVGVDVKSVMASQLYKDNKEQLEGEGKEVIEAAKKCNLGPDTWKSVVVGMDPAKGPGAMVAVISVDGIGKKENLECVQKEAKAANGDKEPFTLEEEGKVLKMEDEGVGYVINDNTLAFAGKDWADTVKKLKDGEGKNAMDGSLKDVVARTDTGKTIWFAGKVPEDMGGMAAGALGFSPKDAAGWVDLSSGLALNVSAGAEDAEKIAGELNTKWEGVKGMASSQGAPQGAVDSVKIGNKDGAVTVEASISDEDLKKIAEQAKGALGGMM